MKISVEDYDAECAVEDKKAEKEGMMIFRTPPSHFKDYEVVWLSQRNAPIRPTLSLCKECVEAAGPYPHGGHEEEYQWLRKILDHIKNQQNHRA